MLSDKDLARLDGDVQEAEALWGDEILDSVEMPAREDYVSIRGKERYKQDVYHEYLCGEEARQIARLIFQLKAAPVDTMERMEALIENHNASLQEDVDDPEYTRTTGVSSDTLLQARMISMQQREIMVTAVRHHGPGVLHGSGYARLLVRHSNQNRVYETLDVLSDAGFLTQDKGLYNANLFISDGRLEAAHRHYLERLANALTSSG